MLVVGQERPSIKHFTLQELLVEVIPGSIIDAIVLSNLGGLALVMDQPHVMACPIRDKRNYWRNTSRGSMI
jgi:hypothetical protein